MIKYYLKRVYSSFLHLFRYAMTVRKYQGVLIGSPLHGNLGDHAIALAENEVFDFLSIRIMDYPWIDYLIPIYALFTPKKHVILINGGGFIGQLWVEEERKVRRVIKGFKRNRIIVMPQTAYYDLTTDEGRQIFEKTRSVFLSHSNMFMFLREKYSYNFFKENCPEIRTCLVPDVTFGLLCSIKKQRHGGMLCLRSDLEKTLTEKDLIELKETIESSFDSYTITDTCLERTVSVDDRRVEVMSLLDRFASSELVITDRLHGMIFSAITETPCIVLPSLSYKIIGCYEWISDLNYVKLAKSVEEISDLISMLSKVTPRYERNAIWNLSEPLRKQLSISMGQETDK